MKKITALFVLIILTGLIINLDAQQVNKTRLNDGWKFLKGDLGGIWEAVRPVKAGDPESVPVWESVTLPHCFNASDAVDPDVNYYQGPGWYKKEIEIRNPYPGGRTLLHFEGAGQKTAVYVHTMPASNHTGGYDEFSVDITDLVNKFTANPLYKSQFKEKIPLAVRCENSRDLEMIPSDLSDFNLYGGLYRYVNLVYVPSFYFENIFMTANPSSDKKSGSVKISGAILGKGDIKTGSAEIKILSPDRKVISTTTVTVEAFEGKKELLAISVKNPILWSPSNPALYSCEVTLKSPAGEQIISEKFGFRSFGFISKGPFM